jgi:hypothetical protein
MNNWKTTMAGILSALLGTIPALTAFVAAMQTIQAQQPGHPPANYTFAYIGAGLSFLAAAGRVWIGLLENDAPANPPPAQLGTGSATGKQ